MLLQSEELHYSLRHLLSNNTHYYASQTVAGCESITRLDVTALIFSIPLPPVAGAGTGATCSQITANWAASAGAASYRLDVSTVNTFASFVAGYQDRNVGNVITFNVTGLTAGVTYYYRVRAVDFCGTSGNSLTITYATLPAAPATPGAITGTVLQCSGSPGQIYSISAVPNATTYTWTVPAGWSINSRSGNYNCNSYYRCCRTEWKYNCYCRKYMRNKCPSNTGSNCNPQCQHHLCDRSQPVMYWRHSNLYSQWSCSQRRYRSLEQQQSGSSYSQRCRIGNRNISRNMQYYLHYNRRLRRYVSAQQPVTINPNASITSVTGTSPLCIGGTATYTANGVVLSGGTGAWSSSNAAVATVSAAGLVTGVSAGTCNIIYTITGGCGGTVSAQQPVTINPNASITSVTGTTPYVSEERQPILPTEWLLSGGTGAWSSSNPAVATVSAAGLVTGVSAGTCNIIYTITGGCGGTVSAQQPVTINPNASITSVTGATPLCIGGTATYTANGVVLSGGTGAWSSSNRGSSNSQCCRFSDRSICRHMQYYLYYYRRLRRQCFSPAISDNKSECSYNFSNRSIPLCIGGTATYTANGVVLSGGTGAWSSSNPAIATVSAAGLVTGVSAGTCNIIYTITGGCGGTVSAQQPVTINPNASITSVTGSSPLCIGGTATYTANGVVLSGGTGAWSSSNPAVATVSAAGLVTGVSAGTCNIIYTITGGCGGTVSAQQAVTINPNASITSVTGSITIMYRRNSNLYCQWSGSGGGTGAWSSSNAAVATVSAAGLVTGVSAGTCNIIYTITGGCGGNVSAQQSVTINPNASITSVTGTTPLMYRRYSNLYRQRSCSQRRNRSMEQQQRGSCNGQCCRIW